MARPNNRRGPRKVLDRDVLAILMLAGKTDEEIARECACSTRTVKRERARARAECGDDNWPRVRPGFAQPAPQPSLAPGADPLSALPELPGPDELEVLAGRIMLAAALTRGPGAEAAGANAVRLLELADRMRAKRGANDDVDPAALEAAVKAAIVRATDNVQDVDPK